MESKFVLESQTIKQLLEGMLGAKHAEELLQTIQKAIDAKTKGEELNKVMYAKLCAMKVTKIEAYQFIHIVLPHIVKENI
jgi:hypothetical protein